MTQPFVFDIKKYLGTWYELAHYPSWFQRNDNYNTKAVYSLNADNTVNVHNSTLTHGTYIESFGTAKNLGTYNFKVEFPIPEVNKLSNNSEFKTSPFSNNMLNVQNNMLNVPNYVVDKIWLNKCGDYIFAVVTDPSKQSFYLLSRYSNPSLISYNEVMDYVNKNYDRDRLVQTPHFC